MNIKEHNSKLKNISRIASISNSKILTFDYEGLKRLSIHSYLPLQIINNIRNLVHDPKLMAKPSKKYKLMNDILRPIGFRHLASGTNRRTFYSIFDEGIVLKIASDTIGEEANLYEFRTQEYIKPFCAKTFDVLPDGLIALSERVEPMKEKEYKEIWSSDIFDFIFLILGKGFIMEDIGGNFFKNWGIRFGFGPVILDYPYIFKVDWHKLKCCKKDPITNEKCLGDLDYNYSKGMSEIICTKCGARYSAKYLAELVNNNTEINRRRESIMSLIPTEVKVTTMRGSTVLKRFYSESEERKDPNISFTHDGSPIITSCFEEKTNNNLNPISKDKKDSDFIFYPRLIKNDIIFFLKKMEQKYGEEIAIELADKLKIRYKVVGYNNRNTNNESDYSKEKNDDVNNTDFWKDKNKKLTSSFIKVNAKKEEDENTEPAKSSADINNTVSLSPDNEKDRLKTLENDMESVLKTIQSDENHNLSPSNQVFISKDEDKSKDVKKSFNKPTEGLFPTPALSAEEIENLRIKSTNESAIMGFPGEPLVDQMRFKEMIPKIKNLVKIKFDNFVIEDDLDQDEISRKLSKRIKDYIFEDIENLMNGDVNELIVDATKTVNERNEECFLINVENRGTKLFSLYLFPEMKVIKNKNNVIDIDKIDNLEKFFTEVADSIDLDKYQDLTMEEAKDDIIELLSNAAIQNYKIEGDDISNIENIKEKADNFVENYFNFSEVESDDETNISNELI